MLHPSHAHLWHVLIAIKYLTLHVFNKMDLKPPTLHTTHLIPPPHDTQTPKTQGWFLQQGAQTNYIISITMMDKPLGMAPNIELVTQWT